MEDGAVRAGEVSGPLRECLGRVVRAAGFFRRLDRIPGFPPLSMAYLSFFSATGGFFLENVVNDEES